MAECLLPEDMVEYFEVVKVEEIPETLEERDKGVDGNAEGRFRPNGFYEESTVRDYPVRGRKMMFHVKRWDIVAEGTRISKKFAAFLKDMLGQVPDHRSLS